MESLRIARKALLLQSVPVTETWLLATADAGAPVAHVPGVLLLDCLAE